MGYPVENTFFKIPLSISSGISGEFTRAQVIEGATLRPNLPPPLLCRLFFFTFVRCGGRLCDTLVPNL